MHIDILYNDLSNDDHKILTNSNIKIKLKEHQKTAIYAMLEFEDSGKVSFTKKAYIYNYMIYDEAFYKNYFYCWKEDDKSKYKDMRFEIETNYGILADKVGSGKTYMAMGLIVNKQIPKERDRIISSSVYTVTRYKDIEVPIKTNLIIVPHNLIIQWKLAFGNCNLKTYTISKRLDINNLEFIDNIFIDVPPVVGADYTELNCVEYYDVIIVSSTMFDVFYNIEKFKNIKWARIIIDEVVSIKLPSDLEFKCNFIWFLTATPSGIKFVKKNYIRSLVSGMSDYTINNIIIKNNDDFVDHSMNLPSLNQIVIKCLTPKELNIIKDFIDNDTVQMINAGNIQEAILKLNCNVETSDNILEVVTKKISKELHNIRRKLSYEQEIIINDDKAHKDKIDSIKEKIKNLETQFESIKERINTFKENNCPICLNNFDIAPMITPCCNNLFCIVCLNMCISKNNKCPLCRQTINFSDCIVINDESKLNSNSKSNSPLDKTLCSKIDNLISLINANPNGKFLLFSNYDKTFENLNQKFDDNKINSKRLVGSNIVINNIIHRFEQGEIKVLMLNALNYGSGLNLQMASDIIIYHELDMELESQVIGRAQRLGRTQPLNVYYLQNDNEKVNCKNPTLNLDIFSNDQTMLEKFILKNTNVYDDYNDNNNNNHNDQIDDLANLDLSNLNPIIKVKKSKISKTSKSNNDVLDIQIEPTIKVRKSKKTNTKKN
jgi:hypothetical protein